MISTGNAVGIVVREGTDGLYRLWAFYTLLLSTLWIFLC